MSAAALDWLRATGELDTASAVAEAHGITLDELLQRWGPRDRRARAMSDLYVALRDRGHRPTAIARMTGRDVSTVKQQIAYRTRPEIRAKLLLRQRRRYAGLYPVVIDNRKLWVRALEKRGSLRRDE